MSVRREAATILLAVALPVWLGLSWGRADLSPPHDDDLALFLMAACLDEKLPEPTAPMACSQLGPYPPLVPLLVALVFRAAGEPDLRFAITSLAAAYGVLALGLYAGVRSEAGRLASLAAAWVGPWLWLTAGVRSSLYTEGWLAAMAASSLGALAWSRGLARAGPSAIFGVALGLGMLVKWSFAFFLAPPTAIAVVAAGARAGRIGLASTVLVVAAAGLLGAGVLGLHPQCHPAGGVVGAVAVAVALLSGRARELAGVAVAVGLPLAIAGPWYVSASQMLGSFLDRNLEQQYAGDALGFAESWPLYPGAAVRDLGLPLLLLAGAGALRTVFPGRSAFTCWCLLAVASATALLMAAPYQAARYLSPAWPLLAPAMLVGRRLAPLHAMLAAAGAVAQASWMIPVDLQRFPWLQQDRTHTAGNTRAGMAAARALLAEPPLRVPIVLGGPMTSAPNLRAMLDALPPTGGPWTVLVVQHASLSSHAMEVELVRRRTPGRVRVVSAGHGRGGTALASAATRAGARFVFEVADYMDEGTGPPAWLVEQEAALREIGLQVRWEYRTEGRNRRIERVWGP